MKRHLFNLLAAVSLALCVAALAAWTLTRRTPIWVGPVSVQHSFLWVRWQTPYEPAPSAGGSRFLARYRFAFVSFSRQESVISSPSGPVRNLISSVYVQLWGIVAVSSLAPAAWALRWSLARRRRPGLCVHCGYDLRATPGRCPECGTPAAVSPVE